MASQERILELRFAARFRKQITLVVLIGVGASILEAIGLLLLLPILQGAFAGPAGTTSIAGVMAVFPNLTPAAQLRLFAVLLIAVYALKSVMVYVNGIQSARLDASCTNYLMTRAYKQILGASSAYMNAQHGSHLFSTLRQHISRVGQLARVLAEAMPPTFTFAVLLVILFRVSWRMTLLAFGFAALASIPVQLLHKRAARAGLAVARANEWIDGTVLRTLSGLKTIHLFDRSADALARFTRDCESWGRTLVSLAKIVSATNPLYEATVIAGLSVLLIVGSYWLPTDAAGVPQLTVLAAFLVVFYRMMPAVAALNRTRVAVSTLIPVCNEVQMFFDESAGHQVRFSGRLWTGLSSDITFRDVSFAYDQRRGDVLSTVSITIPKGAKVGIVGGSGSGKSTIGELLLRFYDPTQGAILADGVDIRDLDLVSWRRRIGVVTQETFLFDDTIAANVAFGLPDASTQAVEHAARRAHIHEFISQLPDGYQTQVGDRGVLLSGGQRQRLAIARAILTDPEILVLDEATSALDSESELVVQMALDEIAEGRTVIAIAHRLSTIANCDLIYVLENGRLMESGSHAALVSRPEGIYRRLVGMQSLS